MAAAASATFMTGSVLTTSVRLVSVPPCNGLRARVPITQRENGELTQVHGGGDVPDLVLSLSHAAAPLGRWDGTPGNPSD
jgi:hypothetical protein